MKFGMTALRDAEGAILAHSLRLDGRVFKKGRVLSATDIADLAKAKFTEVMAARLDASDVHEDIAAQRVAEAARGPGARVSAPFTGRCNLYAEADGIVLVDADIVTAINLLDESLTIATLAPFAEVRAREMIATVKVIPFAAPESAVAAAEGLARKAQGLLRVAPYSARKVGLVSTSLPGQKQSVLDKTREATLHRLEERGSALIAEHRTEHDAGAVANAIKACLKEGAEIVLVFGASAIVDRRDVIPQGIVDAGGVVEHFGMPVDPGNLLLLGHVGAVPVIGLPGCARSPKINGFDWVLQRLLAGVAVSREDIMRMGAGGLLKEIPSRPQPRDKAASAPHAPRIAALILAGGRSARMGSNKLLAPLAGKPLVRWVAEAALQSQARPVIAVTGHQKEQVEAVLSGLDVICVHNPRFADGLSTSLATGLSALNAQAIDGVVVCLGDMPRVTPAHIDRLIAAFDPKEDRSICVPTYNGKRGNPVLWDAAFIPQMKMVTGDAGAKALMGTQAEQICEVAMNDAGVLTDVDTPDALQALTERA